MKLIPTIQEYVDHLNVKNVVLLCFAGVASLFVLVAVGIVFWNASNPTCEGWIVELVKVIGPGIIGYFFGNQSKK